MTGKPPADTDTQSLSDLLREDADTIEHWGEGGRRFMNYEVLRQHALDAADTLDAKNSEIERLRAWCEDEQKKRHQAEEDRMNARSEVAKLKNRIDLRLGNYLCDMRPDYDDSIHGFNEAWNIVRKVFEEAKL